ncbi:hypothetical protein [Cupriavidus pinatubonensis]|uniref:hypothetical protein n=1 Tax=Cupriavidus pinatubonensis TaxID=248026 RepID=UPI00112EFAB6|nr:hypothetical protein [Cupriavidus pinatubonensis]TPQ44141.1 hypothetical protein C2U69_00935 [Cupriavidus pinatubonensis]
MGIVLMPNDASDFREQQIAISERAIRETRTACWHRGITGPRHTYTTTGKGAANESPFRLISDHFVGVICYALSLRGASGRIPA